jgi:hypothetical protein
MARQKIHLRTLADVLRELGRIYRVADRGEMGWLEAAIRARVLREMRVCIEADPSIEERIANLERLFDGDRRRPNGNGHGEEAQAPHHR